MQGLDLAIKNALAVLEILEGEGKTNVKRSERQ